MAAVKAKLIKGMYMSRILCAFSQSVFPLTSECGLLSEQMFLEKFGCIRRSVLALSFIMSLTLILSSECPVQHLLRSDSIGH